MTKILAFDSVYLVNPIRSIYLGLINRILNKKDSKSETLILYRLDKENKFLNDKRNASGIIVGDNQSHIDAMSIKFYRYLEKSIRCDSISIKKNHLYKLYTRQVKLKLTGVLRCAHRIKNLTSENDNVLEVVTDQQTVEIMNEALLFLNHDPKTIQWKVNHFLTLCISVNSLLMRLIAFLRMLLTSNNLPVDYFYKDVDIQAPTVVITMPKRRPETFFKTYVEGFSNQFNIILYSIGPMKNTPYGFKRIRIKTNLGFIRGFFGFGTIFSNASSYIADILLIYRDHANLSTSIDIGDAIFSNKVDALINRQQVHVVDNYLAIEARRRGIYILGDVFEEIYDCDSAICSSKIENTESLELAVVNKGEIVYKGSNSLINYRLKNFEETNNRYLRELLDINSDNQLIFYASDPSKEESQRYLTEKFIVNFFTNHDDFILVMKTHPQDNGRVTYNAYLDSNQPSNIYLIGDIAQKHKLEPGGFQVFENFDFNAAIISSDGFLTFSSSSILQALRLGIKTGIVDKFNNGFYDYLISHNASLLVYDEESLLNFLMTKELDISEDILKYCGLIVC